MEFIEDLRSKNSGCVFCELAEEGDDKSSLILHRGKTCYVLMNKYPYNNGHLLIVPFKHTGTLSDLTAEEHSEMMKLSTSSVEVLKGSLEADGFNCGFNLGRAAGAGIVDHLHMHVVPRWVGDSNFMPIIGNTRSMPEYLEATYDRLIDGFQAIK
jgi:ATP adenylyltransferase